MGLRSWLTRIEEPGDWDFFKKALRINSLSYGVTYVIDIAADIPLLDKGIWVAWSGDTGSSLSYMPGVFIEKTVLLDNLLDYLHDEFPAFELKGPESFGKFLKRNKIEKLLEERWGEDCFNRFFWPEEDEPSPEECQGEGCPDVPNG